MIDLPSAVAPKNNEKGIKKWPHVNPAKSNKGFGILAKKKKNYKI